MDLLTQGLAGALCARAAARPAAGRQAALVGFAAGLLADADALIRSPSDPLLTLEYHRHFSHALLFVPLGALLAALLLWPFLRRRVPPGRLYLFALLGYLPSGLLDACTSYGTLLFWPFSEERIAWRLIAIVDPLFTLGLLLALGIALWRSRADAARYGLLFAVAYLGLGAVQQQRAAAVAAAVAAERGHLPQRALVKPTLGNLVLWRSVYEAEGRFHVDAIRVGATGHRVYPGGALPRFTAADADHRLAKGTTQRRDVERFAAFSEGHLVLSPGRENVIGDIRYANLPTSIDPLWGIELDPGNPAAHARYTLYRDASKATRERFLQLLFGRP